MAITKRVILVGATGPNQTPHFVASEYELQDGDLLVILLGALPGSGSRWETVRMSSALAPEHGPNPDNSPDNTTEATTDPDADAAANARTSVPWPAQDPTHGRIRLRRFVDQDAGMAVELSQDDYIPRIGSLPHCSSLEEGLAWVHRQHRRHATGTGFSFAIVEQESDRPVGNIGLWTKELADGRAQAGYGVIASARGRRVAAEALIALLKFAWTIPELHRLELYIEPWNVASVRSAELAGFEQEGLLRSHQEISGRRVDMLVFSMVRDRRSRGTRSVPGFPPGGPNAPDGRHDER